MYGTVYDETMEDRIRVTVVATGLGAARAVRQCRARWNPVIQAPVPTTSATAKHGLRQLDTPPAVIRRDLAHDRRSHERHRHVDRYDIPAFLRKQAD